MCRHTPKSSGRIGERVVGTKGTSDCDTWIKGATSYKFEGPNTNPLVQEHTDLIASIRKGEPLNEGERVALSTLTAIGGRISAYTGREISWNWLLNGSKLDIFPKQHGPGPGVFTAVPVPGMADLV
jgi:hypothetical protein